MKLGHILTPLLVVAGIGALSAMAVRDPVTLDAPAGAVSTGLDDVVSEADAWFDARWSADGIEPAETADDLTVLRRLSLALHGTIPSLEEIRQFESDDRPDRLEQWTAAMLDDTRFADYFAERLARAFVGVEQGQFVIFRRDRFTNWLSRQLRDDRPYDEIVRDMIGGQGVWTGKGEVNFVTAAFANDEFDPNKLTARTVRSFLGQRIDCAQCHDHPFDDWTQAQFEGLTAHYAPVSLSLVGVEDADRFAFELSEEHLEELQAEEVTDRLRRVFRKNDQRIRKHARLETLVEGQLWVVHDGNENEKDDLQPRFAIHNDEGTLRVSNHEGEYIVNDTRYDEVRVVPPAVPFHPEWLGQEGTPRQRLAEWVTHPENQRFERALVNRVWGLMFGRPFASDRPVDDLPDPDDPATAESLALLDMLGDDFREHNCSVKRLVQVIAASRPFRLASDVESASETQIEELEQAWAVFPLVRLRPEQVIGSMLQAASVKTIDRKSHLFVRFLRFVREENFVDEFGDPGENELSDRVGTIPQALLRMNGQLASELTEPNPFGSVGRIAALAGSPEATLDACYLICLTRRPTQPEREHFLPQLEKRREAQAIQDLFWALYNSPEFSWNH
ncbi:hypothetical protein Mal4_13000 [Maioricimonas rarisocia]|uniref:DUF1549 domain-containing protein n=1 Tax=Maioricimonas rarisocia TaxID=2528026 RepID=A0A517Z3I7_9PLAN|nr:DUF1549 domain-containing protein [Maioricimonas rarisocia]QDU36997.1 hypothetical protein Mal4_13000 [Maioricimonas rarisocia]